MRSNPGYTVVALLLIAGLAFGSAVHRVQHGLDYARSASTAHEASFAHFGKATLGDPVQPTVVEEAICILCQVVNAQVLLAPTTWHLLDPGRVTVSGAMSRVRTASIALLTGRSPPRRI